MTKILILIIFLTILATVAVFQMKQNLSNHTGSISSGVIEYK